MPRDEPARDEELMVAYRDGNLGAFEALYRRHKGGLYRYLLRQCRDNAVAEELFQDVWLNLIRSRGSYVVSSRFTTYLYRVAHNRLIDHYRRQAPAARRPPRQRVRGRQQEAFFSIASSRPP